jgi:hypothetical protein
VVKACSGRWSYKCWRKLRVEELINTRSSPNIIKMIKSGLTTWMGHVASWGQINSYILAVA